MNPVSQPKPLDDVFEKLQRCLWHNQPLGDIDKFNFKKRLEEQLTINPVNVHMGLGILAVYEDKEAIVHKHFTEALRQQPASIVYYNYALALAHLGCTEEAVEQLRLALNTADPGVTLYQLAGFASDAHQGYAPVWHTTLDQLAGLALSLGADELIPEILEKARKLKVEGPMLVFAAIQMGLACEGDEEAYIARMGKFLPDDTLRKHSRRITDEEWQEMYDFADSLQKYV